MALNPFFLQGAQSEQRLTQDLINEHLRTFGVEVETILRKEGFKIDKKSLYFKRLFRQLKENLIEVKHRTIQRKRDLILGERKSEWDLVDDLMEELKHEKVKQVINSIPESELEKESPLLSQVRVSFIDSRKQMGSEKSADKLITPDTSDQDSLYEIPFTPRKWLRLINYSRKSL